MQRRLRSALALGLSVALAAISPGPRCFAALAERPRAVQIPAPVLVRGLAAPVAQLVSQAGLTAAEARQSPLAALALPQPEFGRMDEAGAKAESGTDFSRRIGQDESAGQAQDEPEASAAPEAERLPSPSREIGRRGWAPRAPPAPLFALALAAGLMTGIAGHLGGLLIQIPVLIVSAILHEMGHAEAAYRLGDPTAVLANRRSFSPRHLLTHIDPVYSILLPVALALAGWPILAGARPVPVDDRNFRKPLRDMALVAMAGPAVNVVLAALSLAAIAGLSAFGVGGVALAVAHSAVLVNGLLAFFNLLWIYPLDGHHVGRLVLPRAVSRLLYEGPQAWIPLVLVYLLSGHLWAPLSAWLSHLMAGAASVGHAALASAALPAVAAFGLLIGQIQRAVQPPEPPEQVQPPAPVAPAETPIGDPPAELIVLFDGAPGAVTEDAHLSFVRVTEEGGVARYGQLQEQLLAQLSRAGLSKADLEPFNATPIAAYRRVNAATFRVDASQAEAFSQLLRGRGFRVYPNSRRRIIEPVPVSPPDEVDPAARNPVTMPETLKLTRADSVIAIGQRRWGPRGLLRRLFGAPPAPPPQPALAVIDSGADTAHPLLKGVKQVVNVTSGESRDDIGHGTWVTSMVLNYAPWSRNLTHYKTFTRGSASLDDILKALTAAGNDGNLVISNSWGSDDGDPESPDSLLVKKLAEEGRILVFAAGNAGPGVNTIGSPAIVHSRDPKTGAVRVLSVAAADRNKKIAFFSSRGPGSPATKKRPDYPRKPDLTAVGVNTEGAWPGDLKGADRVDPQAGPIKANSGTSMSTPDVAGAIALLCILFGVTTVGPQLDAVAAALMATLEKTGQSPNAEGDGFLNVEAAYHRLAQTLAPLARPGLARALVRRLVVWLAARRVA